MEVQIRDLDHPKKVLRTFLEKEPGADLVTIVDRRVASQIIGLHSCVLDSRSKVRGELMKDISEDHLLAIVGKARACAIRNQPIIGNTIHVIRKELPYPASIQLASNMLGRWYCA